MKFLKYLAIAVTTVLVLQACSKDITVQPLPYNSKLSFQSILLPGTLPKVNLSRSVPYFDQNVTPSSAFVRNANVVISGDGVDETLHADSTYNYFLCRWEPFYIGDIATKADVTYTLTIDADGKTYSAQTTTDVAAVQMDSVTYVFAFNDIYGEHEGVVVDFTDPVAQTNYYRFEMTRDIDTSATAVGASGYKSQCLGDSSVTVVEVGRFVIYDRDANGLPIRFVVEPSYKHKLGTVGYVRLQTLDKNAADFYDQLDKQRQANANPFIEPVFLKSNIDGTIGVFGSMNLSEPIQFIFPE